MKVAGQPEANAKSERARVDLLFIDRKVGMIVCFRMSPGSSKIQIATFEGERMMRYEF